MIARIAFERDAAASLDGIRVVDLSCLVASIRVAREGSVAALEGVCAQQEVPVPNLRPQGGRDTPMDLLAQNHVLIENHRPGTLEEMGLAADQLVSDEHIQTRGMIVEAPPA